MTFTPTYTLRYILTDSLTHAYTHMHTLTHTHTPINVSSTILTLIRTVPYIHVQTATKVYEQTRTETSREKIQYLTDMHISV